MLDKSKEKRIVVKFHFKMASAQLNAGSKDWLSWFNSRDSFSVINKANQEKLFATFNFSISKSDCIESISAHEETAFLQKSNFGSKKINLFHHLLSVGGTVYDSSSKVYGCIQGAGLEAFISIKNFQATFLVFSHSLLSLVRSEGLD